MNERLVEEAESGSLPVGCQVTLSSRPSPLAQPSSVCLLCVRSCSVMGAVYELCNSLDHSGRTLLLQLVSEQ